MAKKLTNEVLEKLVMESIEEMGDVNEVFEKFFSTFSKKPQTTAPFGRPAPKGPRGAKGGMEQLLNLIQMDQKVPQYIKDFAAEVLITLPELPASAVQPLKATGTAKLPDDYVPSTTERDETVSRAPELSMPASSDSRKAQYAKYGIDPNSPGARSKLASAISKDQQRGQGGKFAKLAAESRMLEALVAEVLAEMSKKKEAPKQPKKPVKK
jgi:hypothetical protein